MFKQGIVTAYGKALEAKVRLGLTTIVFTKLATGDGEYTGDLRELKALVSEKQRFGISSLTVSEASTVRLRTVIDNNGISSGYYIREIGLFAIDPDAGEILYSVMRGVDGKLDYQPSESEFDKSTMTLDIFVRTVSAETATIMTGSGAAASAEDLHELDLKKINVVLMTKEIPINEREERTYYLRVTDHQTVNITDAIKVSPNMGLKIL